MIVIKCHHKPVWCTDIVRCTLYLIECSISLGKHLVHHHMAILISAAVICVLACFHSRRVVVDCLAYPYTVFCRQCQVFPYNAATVSISAPFSTTVVLHHIAQTQVTLPQTISGIDGVHVICSSNVGIIFIWEDQ